MDTSQNARDESFPNLQVDTLVTISSGQFKNETKLYRIIKRDDRYATLQAHAADGSLVKGAKVVRLKELTQAFTSSPEFAVGTLVRIMRGRWASPEKTFKVIARQENTASVQHQCPDGMTARGFIMVALSDLDVMDE